jgi:hypothetical protein
MARGAAVVRSTMLALLLAQAWPGAADTVAATPADPASDSSAPSPVSSTGLEHSRSAFKLRLIPLSRVSSEPYPMLLGAAASVELAPIWVGEIGADLMLNSVGTYFAVGVAPTIDDARDSDATGSFHRANLMLGFRHIDIHHEPDGHLGTETDEVAFMMAGLDFTWWQSRTFGLSLRIAASVGLPFAQTQSWTQESEHLRDIELMSVFVDGSISFGFAFAL